jgi:hypothetical protein
MTHHQNTYLAEKKEPSIRLYWLAKPVELANKIMERPTGIRKIDEAMHAGRRKNGIR